MILFPHTAEIYRRTRVTDNEGGFRWEWLPVKVTRARLAPAGGRDILMGQQMQVQITHRLYLPAHIELRNEDEVVVNGRRVQIIVADLTPSVPHHKKALAREITS